MNERKRQRPGTVMEVSERSARKKKVLGPDIQQKIGKQLRAMYSDVVNEGVPDRFAELLRELDNKDGEQK